MKSRPYFKRPQTETLVLAHPCIFPKGHSWSWISSQHHKEMLNIYRTWRNKYCAHGLNEPKIERFDLLCKVQTERARRAVQSFMLCHPLNQFRDFSRELYRRQERRPYVKSGREYKIQIGPTFLTCKLLVPFFPSSKLKTNFKFF